MTFAFLIYISSAYASVLSEAKTTVSEIQNVYKDMEKKAKDAAKSGDKQTTVYYGKNVIHITTG